MGMALTRAGLDELCRHGVFFGPPLAITVGSILRYKTDYSTITLKIHFDKCVEVCSFVGRLGHISQQMNGIRSWEPIGQFGRGNDSFDIAVNIHAFKRIKLRLNFRRAQEAPNRETRFRIRRRK